MMSDETAAPTAAAVTTGAEEAEAEALLETIDVDDGDDALADLIHEAEHLMQNLDKETSELIPTRTTRTTSTANDAAVPTPTTAKTAAATTTATTTTLSSPIIGGFSIDSDDESEDDFDPLTAAVANANTAPVNDHPLSMENLTSPSPIQNNGMMSELASSPHMAANPNGMSNMNMNMNMNTAATMDSLKQQTTRFASGLASIAQRAAHQVAAATAPVQAIQVTGGPTPPTTMGSLMTGGLSSPSLGLGLGLGPGPISSSTTTTTTTTTSNVYSPTYPAHMQQQQRQQPLQFQQQPKPPGPNARTALAANGGAAPPATTELDKDQKERLIQDHVGSLLPGERIIMFLSNLLHVSVTSGLSYVASQQSGEGYMWCCAMSYYRLILFSTAPVSQLGIPKPNGWNAACWPASTTATKFIEIPLAAMDRVEKTVYQAAGNSYMGIVLTAKDCGRVIRFTTPSYADTGRAFESLNTYAFPGRRNLGYLFAFESKRPEVMASVHVDATTGQQSITLPPTPKRFDPMMEFPRLLNQTSITNAPWMLWGSINTTYQLSPTYPSVLVGPATLDETKPESQHVILQCAAFRSGQRLPALSWSGVGGASIWRASQPKVGLQGNRSPADELYLRHVAESARGANAMADPPPIYSRSTLQQLTGDYAKDWVPEPGCGLKILDLRPRSSAMANRTGGYGYENTSNYANTTLQFCNIGNIHAVRDAYQKLCTVCNSESTVDVSFHSLLEDTKWLSHIRIILAASWETAYWVHVWRMPVLVHCSHGWDRTSQVSALAQIFLDPYYRTLQGFSVLVEKDFMSFGHPFHLRSAHGEGRNTNNSSSAAGGPTLDEGQISPIFLQFLDCVYQIVQLFPEAFEFNTRYLLEFSFHIYSCRFGNMLCDTEREREVLAGIRQRTYSVWDYLEGLEGVRNPDFITDAGGDGVLLMPLPTLLRNVRLWTERHCYHSRKPTIIRSSCSSGNGSPILGGAAGSHTTTTTTSTTSTIE